MENNIKKLVVFIIEHPCITLAMFYFIAAVIIWCGSMTMAKVIQLFFGMFGVGSILDMILDHILPIDNDNDEGDDLF